MRRFIAGGLLLLLAGCRQKENTPLQIDPALEALVPADTVFIMGVNVDAIRNTQVYQKYIGVLNLPNLNQFAQQTGIDPRNDLSQVLSVSNGKAGALIARGKFKPGDLEPKLQAQGAKRTAYKDYNLFGDDQRSVLFMNAGTALAGSTSLLKSIIEARDSPRHGLPPALGEKLKSIPSGSQIWAALVGGVPGLNLGVPDNSNLGNVIRLVQGIDSAAVGIDLRNGLDLNANAICRSDAHAKRLHDALRGIIGLGRLSTPDNQPDLLKLYDAIKVGQAQNRVDVTAHIPPDLANRFIDLWIKRR